MRALRIVALLVAAVLAVATAGCGTDDDTTTASILPEGVLAQEYEVFSALAEGWGSPVVIEDTTVQLDSDSWRPSEAVKVMGRPERNKVMVNP